MVLVGWSSLTRYSKLYVYASSVTTCQLFYTL